MTDKINDGGPAFPVPSCPTGEHNENGSMIYYEAEPGMSLRDWLAGLIVQGYVTRGFDNTMDAIAKEAYAQADAMLNARKS